MSRHCRYVGASLSIVCLCVVLALHFLTRMDEVHVPLQKRALVHLAATYLVALVLFVSAIEYGKTGTDDSTCAVIGGLLHYFLLASFCWMAVEGQILYQMFVVVFTLTSKTFDGERLRKYVAALCLLFALHVSHSVPLPFFLSHYHSLEFSPSMPSFCSLLSPCTQYSLASSLSTSTIISHFVATMISIEQSQPQYVNLKV